MKKIICIGMAFQKRILLAALIGGLNVGGWAADYLGANGVLQEVAAKIAKPVEKPPESESSKLRDELNTFTDRATNLAPADAAKQWLALVDRALKLQQTTRPDYASGDQPIAAEELLAALPPPPAWGELAKAIGQRPPAKTGDELRESGLRLLAATLTKDSEAQKREFTALQSKAADLDAQTAAMYNSFIEGWSRATLAISDDPDAVLKSLEYELASTSKQGQPAPLILPNLVSQVGPEKAEAFLKKCLVTPNVMLQFQQPNETSRLAQKLAAEMMGELKLPQWGLVNSLDAANLYEALEKQFPEPTNSPTLLPGLANVTLPPDSEMRDARNSGKDQAEIYYLLGLISQNRSKDAVVIAKKLNPSNQEYVFDQAFKVMEHAGYTEALDDFLFELLSENPSLLYWNQYVQTAAAVGKTERMLTLVRATLAKSDLSDAKKAAIGQILFPALLAADEVDEGVTEMRRQIALNDAGTTSDRFTTGQLGVMLARIGMLENNTNWTEEGIGIAKKWLATTAGQNQEAGEGNVLASLAQMLFDLQRGPEAESLLTEALINASRSGVQPEYSWNNNSPSQQILSQLALIYHKAGRYEDVLGLLQQAPGWGVKDVSGLFETSPWDNGFNMVWLHTGSSPTPVPYLAANAMIVLGQKEPARKIVNELLLRYPGLDRGYELLLALDGTNAIPELDQVFSHDQFEERPLIWKAHLLRQQNRLDAAEKIIRQAIAIDPSDGEEGRGDRMRAYAELADILDARGNQKDAKFYREVVKAIRLSENADQFYEAGLLKHAITMYKEGLDHFSDAYCIQSRLAIQLSALGKTEEAEEHYRRAFELMPDSFGRVESHCFGCEKAFDGERAQNIAEQVFLKIAAERPDKPQVHYLLGYLRTEEERYNEARTNFLAAVRLDPDYLNAWVKLQETSAQTLMPSNERDEMIFNILRLDPNQRHTRAAFTTVSDLSHLWETVAMTAEHRPKLSNDLWVLAGSKAALEKKGPDQRNDYMERMIERQMNRQSDLSPGQAISETQFVALTGQLITGNSYFQNY